MSEAPVKSKNGFKKTGIALLVIVLICLLAYTQVCERWVLQRSAG